jgi:hypothetical protein
MRIRERKASSPKPPLQGIHEIPDPRFKRGDHVRLRNTNEYFHFLRRVRNAAGTEWIDLYGGDGPDGSGPHKQRRRYRSVDPELVVPQLPAACTNTV